LERSCSGSNGRTISQYDFQSGEYTKLLNLDTIHENRFRVLIQADLDIDPVLARADECECVRFRNELGQVFGPVLGLAVAHEIAHSAHDLAGANCLGCDFLQRLAGKHDLVGVHVAGKQVGKAFAVACDRGQRLIELMGER